MTRLTHVVLAVLLLGCTSVVAAGPEHAESYLGEVLIRSNGSTIVVLIDTNKDGRDGFVDQWFTLETEGAIVPVSERLKAAQITHTAGYLRVMSPDQGVVYDFVVAGQDRALDAPEGFTKVRSEGYGLSHTFAPTEIRIDRDRRDAVNAIDGSESPADIEPENPDLGDYGAGGSAYTCGSGGTGSTSCSASSGATSSCSVTCSSGYYACCNSNSYTSSCKCYRNI